MPKRHRKENKFEDNSKKWNWCRENLEKGAGRRVEERGRRKEVWGTTERREKDEEDEKGECRTNPTS